MYCRCIAIEVRPGKHKLSDPVEAAQKGEKATTQLGRGEVNKAAIFRFNPGKRKVIFPPKHPYRKVQGADGAKPVILSIINPEGEKALRKNKDEEIRNWAKKNIPDSGKKINVKNMITGEIIVSRKSIKSIGDHFTDPDLKEVAKHVISNLKKAKHINSAPLDPNSPNFIRKKKAGVTQYHYYEFNWKNKKFRLNTEEINGKFEKPYAVNLIIKK